MALRRARARSARELAARELAETRAVLLDDLERKNRELESFNDAVSHDLRAPLRAVEGFSRALMEDHGAELSAGALENAQRICAAASRMSRLIDDLLHLSRIGRLPLRRQAVDLTVAARELAAELQQTDPTRRVTFEIEEGLVAQADPGLVRIALDNLLGNAWKFTAHAAHPRITLGVLPGSEPRTFVVADTGAGFDMAHAARLFSPFQRLHGADEFPGTGIGLATVHRVIDRHGGRIWAEGRVGEGARFLFTLKM